MLLGGISLNIIFLGFFFFFAFIIGASLQMRYYGET